jgi:hypothetical protein
MFGQKKEHTLSPQGARTALILDKDRERIHFEAGGRKVYPYNSVPDKPGDRTVSKAFHRWALTGTLLAKNRIHRP